MERSMEQLEISKQGVERSFTLYMKQNSERLESVSDALNNEK